MLSISEQIHGICIEKKARDYDVNGECDVVHVWARVSSIGKMTCIAIDTYCCGRRKLW